MIVAAVVLLVSLSQSPRDGGCTEWHDCRQLALAAADRGDYQTFHDLAWRAVQTGPPKDPALMYLLARAQALSGRPHDALIMLKRLAEMDVPSDAVTNEDFSRTRQLPGWADVAARIDRLVHPDSPPAAAPAAPALAAPARAAATSAAAVGPRAPSSASASEAVRFSTEGFALGGVAYDAVSRRFLFGDRLGRKLIVVGEGSNHAIDFVRADSAGFHEISAVEIDARRGDLWVTSVVPADGEATLHKLQLVSGRPLRAFLVSPDLKPVELVDLAVTPGGTVLVLDSVSGQLLMLRAGGTSLERVMRIDAREPKSLAVGADDGVAYVAHRDGVSRIDLRARTATLVAAPRSISLAHLERIRWRRHSLIAVRVDDDGVRRIVQFELNATGRAVTAATPLEGPVPAAGQAFVTVSGDELVYLVDGSANAAARPPRDAASDKAEFVAYRLRLR